LKKLINEKIQYKIGIKNSAASAIVIKDVAAILLLDFFSKNSVKELVATVNNIDTKIAFKNGLNNSTIKKIITIAIAIIK
jgi:uncharacterized protein (UPF0128 family)